MPSSTPREASSKSLDCWKAIADYLHRDVRTVMRWERTRGLPVHRLPGGGKAAVFATQAEIDAWRRASSIHAVGTDALAEMPPARTSVPSVAVLPFANLSGNEENQFFADGLADEIITMLAREPGLRVTARTSSFIYRQKELDVRAIGARLGVAAVVGGSLQRDGDRVRVWTQLATASDGCQQWGQRYDRKLTDVFAVQEEIANAIATALKVRLSDRASEQRERISNMDAYCLWLKGRQLQYNRQCAADYEQEGEYFMRACQLDPDRARAHLSLAEHLRDAAVLAMRPPRDVCAQGRDAVDRALALDQALGEAYALRGTFRAIFDYDWSGAEADFTTALDLEPGSPAVRCAHALWVLMPTLQLEQAEAELARALEADPLSRETHFFMGMLLYFRRQYERSKAALGHAIELGGYPMAEWLLGVIEAAEGRPDVAISRCEAAASRFGGIPGFMAGLGTLYGWAGRNQSARSILRKLEHVAASAYVSPLCWAWVHMGLGEAEDAFRWLGRAVEEHDPQIIHLGAKPMYDDLRPDPRFVELLRRMSLERFVVQTDPRVHT